MTGLNIFVFFLCVDSAQCWIDTELLCLPINKEAQTLIGDSSGFHRTVAIVCENCTADFNAEMINVKDSTACVVVDVGGYGVWGKLVEKCSDQQEVHTSLV